MRKIFFILLLFSAFAAEAQYAPMTAYGYKYKRLMADSTLHIPNFCGVPTLQDTTTKKAALAFDSCNNRLYFYNPKTFTWGYFSGSGFDTSTIYQTINNLTQYIYDTSFTNQFMPAGILLDTTYFVAGTDDSVRAYVYTDSTVVYDTLGTSLISSITNNITNILGVIDSIRSDTSFYISTILNGDTLLKVRHNPNNRNDTIYFTLVASNPTRDGYMPKEAWSLFNDGQEGLINGGRVTWLTNYTYNVSEAWYRIDSVIYHSPSTNITLDAAHATLDRIDLFLLTTSNTAVKLTGTAGSGIPPDYDANLYLEASFALVTANTTSPPNIVQKWIYRENLGTAGGEFDVVSNSVRMNVNSTNNPDLGTKTIEGTLVQNNDYMEATAGAGFTMAPYNVLVFRIRSKATWANTRKLVIRAKSAPLNFTGNNVVIGSGTYGFNTSNTATYQTITIPLSHFGNMTNPNSFRFYQTNTSGTVGWYIDNIQLQNVQSTTLGVFVTDITKNTAGDSFYVWKDGNITRRLKDSTGGGSISLTTTGTSGAATLVGSTLNIPVYSGGSGGNDSAYVNISTPPADTSLIFTRDSNSPDTVQYVVRNNNQLNNISYTGGSPVTVFGGAAIFNRSLRHSLFLPSNQSVMIDTSGRGLTISGWVKLYQNDSAQAIASKDDNLTLPGTEYLLCFYPAPHVRFLWQIETNTTTRIVTSSLISPPAINTWYYIEGRYDQANTKIYIRVNNTLDSLDFAETTFHNVTATPFTLGSNSDFYSATTNSWLNGELKNVRVFKRPLTTAESDILYNSGTPLPYTSIPNSILSDPLFISSWDFLDRDNPGADSR